MGVASKVVATSGAAAIRSGAEHALMSSAATAALVTSNLVNGRDTDAL